MRRGVYDNHYDCDHKELRRRNGFKKKNKDSETEWLIISYYMAEDIRHFMEP